MNRNLFPLLMLMALFVQCEESEPNPPTKLFTLNVDDKYLTSSSDDWVVVQDESGEPVVYQSFEEGEEFLLETEKRVSGNSIGVTLLKRNTVNGVSKYNVTTYLGLEKGSVKKLIPPQSVVQGGIRGDLLGTFKLTVSTSSNLPSSVVSDKHGTLTTWNSASSPAGGYQYNFTVSIYQNANKFIFSGSDRQGNLRYKILENVTPGSSISIDFEQLNEFDKTTEFVFPQTSNFFLLTQAQDSSQPFAPGYITYFGLGGGQIVPKLKVGYLNSMSKYYTLLTLSYPGYSYVYFNQGGLPEPQVVFPSTSSFTISSNLISDFTSTSSQPFILRQSTFLHKDPSNNSVLVQWNVYSSSTSHVLKDLPPEILAAHPALSLANLKHTSTTFQLGASSYQEAILPDQYKDEYVYKSIRLE